MPSQEQVIAQIDGLGTLGLDAVTRVTAILSLSKLSQVLYEDEVIFAICNGRYRDRNNGLVIASNYRVLLVTSPLIGGAHTEDFGYDKITSIETMKGLMLSKLRLVVPGNQAIVEQITNPTAANFVSVVRDVIYRLSQPQSPAPSRKRKKASAESEQAEVPAKRAKAKPTPADEGSMAGIPCPSCKATNSQGSKFCSSCGSALPSPAPVNAFCTNCGTALGPDSQFCTSCGAKASAP